MDLQHSQYRTHCNNRNQEDQYQFGGTSLATSLKQQPMSQRCIYARSYDLCCIRIHDLPCIIYVSDFVPNYLEQEKNLSVLIENKQILWNIIQILQFFSTLLNGVENLTPLKVGREKDLSIRLCNEININLIDTNIIIREYGSSNQIGNRLSLMCNPSSFVQKRAKDNK